MQPSPSVTAWRPDVPGVSEVLYASFTDHAYPLHTHDTWTLLLVDTGAVRYDLERHEHAALGSRVTLLPPGVPHDGRAATPDGFRKRVAYLDADTLDVRRIGRAVDHPAWVDLALWRESHLLHEAMRHPGDTFEAEVRLTLVTDRLNRHLARLPEPAERWDSGLAARLRELLDENVVEGISLASAATLLGAHPTHLVRSFRRTVGIAPHRYQTGRRLDLARRLLLSGRRPAEVAVVVGFHDQSHLTRHFKRMLGVTPSAYASSHPRTAR